MTTCAVLAGFVLLAVPQIHAADALTRIAFERGNSIWIVNADGTQSKKIAEGGFPGISRDGTRIAFNTIEKTGDTYVRHIAVVDIASGKARVFKNVPSANVCNATWSPDGSRILFTLRSGELWDIGILNADGTGFRAVKKATPNEPTLYSPSWAGDGQSFFCQDMSKLYRFGLEGAVLGQWEISKIVPNGDMSGDGRISVSPDGKRLLLSVDMGEEHQRKDWDGPPPALWSVDLDTRKGTRITPKNLFGWDGCWLDDDNVVCLSQEDGEKDPSIYRMSATGHGQDRKRLVKDGRLSSAASSTAAK
jgi:TolB protein